MVTTSEIKNATHDDTRGSTERIPLPYCVCNVAKCTCGTRADCECDERERTSFARRRDERTVDCDLYEVVRRAQIRRLNKEGLVLALGIPPHYVTECQISAEDASKDETYSDPELSRTSHSELSRARQQFVLPSPFRVDDPS